ncbi:universal stress protein [Flaviaesturariibacter flavus]|uniref:Universal stress protein n=1 Tax=Flaviaesturariibacter flavus TaxID=2502780 RepID=A0A4V2NV52_9BACT|nr:universal stress protein [Flaviaesturariibacter flavus]TCJ12136.1 universal stress protein [Flaviaesturariibacter flavus]
MKRILVPTDFSPNADKAFDYAVQIAGKTGAELLVLHACAFPLPEYAEQPEDLRQYNRVRALGLQERLDDYLLAAPGQVKTLLVDGRTVDAILEKSRRYEVDLIVMGTRGAGSLKTLLFGTRTEAVIAASRIPVIAVPESYTGGAPKNILLAVQEEESETVLAPAFHLRELFGASLKTVVFSDTNEPVGTYIDHEHGVAQATGRWKASFSLPELKSEHLVGSGFCETIENYAEDQDMNLLVMITRANASVPHLFSSSMTREMALRTEIPLLTLHA